MSDITNDILLQYIDLTKEVEELKLDIKKLENEIDSLEEQIENFENDEIVKDKVYGGDGGIQGFVIRGIPKRKKRSLENKKTKLLQDKLLVEQRKEILVDRESMVKGQILEIEKFISSISDGFLRRIFKYRVIERLSWGKVAEKIGGENTEDSVKKAYQRYIKQTCPICPEKI